jgi:hypothetical protein
MGSAQCITNGDFENTSQYGTSFFEFSTRKSNFNVVDCGVNTSVGFTTVSHNTINSFLGSEPEEGTWTYSPASTPVYEPLLATAMSSTTGSVTTPGPVNIKVVSTGSRAVKLNKSAGGSDITTMKMNISPTTNTISFDYFTLMQYHSGSIDIQPFFTARIIDLATNQIVNTNEICIKAHPNNPIFSSAIIPGSAYALLYTGWKCARLQIPNNLIGRSLRLEFVITDCGESGHYGTVYIDNVTCNAACTPPTGLISLNETNITCPTQSFQVCGTYSAPLGSTLAPSGLTLKITDSNNNVAITSTTTSSLTSSTFCFQIDPQLFAANTIGDLEIRVDAFFNIPGTPPLTFQYHLFDTSSNPGADIAYTIEPIAATFDNGFLTWNDISDSYDLEFIADDNCSPGVPDVNQGMYYSITVTENKVDLDLPLLSLQAKSFRWRIKPSCGSWSEWCCISSLERYGFQGNFGNPLAPNCYDGELTCLPSLHATTNVNGTVYEQRKVFISAVNTIQNNSKATYIAGEYITLQPGFNTQLNSLFLADIEECTGAYGVTTTNSENMYANYKEDEKIESSIEQINSPVVFPNPTNSNITINSNNYINSFVVYDTIGKELLRVSNSNKTSSFDIDLTALAKGLYFLYGDGILIQKVLKN